MAANKTTWKPGQSGNPQGRPPRKVCLTDGLRFHGAEPVALPDGTETTKVDALARQVWALALAGERWAAELIFNRLEGRVVEAAPLEDTDPRRIVTTPMPEPGQPIRPPADADEESNHEKV